MENYYRKILEKIADNHPVALETVITGEEGSISAGITPHNIAAEQIRGFGAYPCRSEPRRSAINPTHAPAAGPNQIPAMTVHTLPRENLANPTSTRRTRLRTITIAVITPSTHSTLVFFRIPSASPSCFCIHTTSIAMKNNALSQLPFAAPFIISQNACLLQEAMEGDRILSSFLRNCLLMKQEGHEGCKAPTARRHRTVPCLLAAGETGDGSVSPRKNTCNLFCHRISYIREFKRMPIKQFMEDEMRHLMSPLDFTVDELDRLLDLANDIEANPEKYAHACDGKKLATLFYEPSTRTRLSFEAAMLNLGGSVLGFSSADSSSAAKGESVSDTIRVISCYADIAAMRHPKEGAPLVAAMHSGIPVINAGDGGHQHPTQTLTDLLTIRSLKGRLGNMTIGLCGDLKFGRTVHSLINALIRYPGIRFVLISPEELRIPDYVRDDVLRRNNQEFREVIRLEEALPELDILYMTRVQRERFFNEEDYVRMKDFYVLDKAKMQLAPKDMMVLHPLPRVNEISVEVDNDPRAAYFRQAQYGVYVRMALILTLLEVNVC